MTSFPSSEASAPEGTASDPAVVDLRRALEGMAERSKAFLSGRPGKFPFVPQHTDMDCAAACLDAINTYHGVPIGLARCREAIRLGREGASLHDIQLAAEELGYEALGFRVDDVGEVGELGLPLIAGTQRHFVVVFRVTTERVWVMDPAIGVHSRPRSEFAEEADVVYLALAPSPRLREIPTQRVPYLDYLRLLAPHRSELGHAFACALLLLVLGLAGPILYQLIFDGAFRYRSESVLALVALGYGVTHLGAKALAVLRRVVLQDLAAKLHFSLGTRVHAHLFSLPLDFFQRRRSGDVSRTLDEVDTVREFLGGEVLPVVLQLMNLVVYLAVLFAYSVKLGAMTIALLPVFAAGPFLYAPLQKRLRYELFNKLTRLDSTLQEQITALRTIKILGGERLARARFRERVRDVLAQQRRGALLSLPFTTGVDLLEAATRVGVLMLGARMVVRGELSTGQMVAGVALVTQVLEPLGTLASKWSDFQDFRVSVDKLHDVLSMRAEELDERSDAASRLPTGDLVFEDVSFSYGREDEAALEGFSATFRRGELTAIVGRSGSGKTTVAQLANRLQSPSRGRVLLGGVDLASVPLPLVRRSVSLVLQDQHLFRGTVLENLGFGINGEPNEPIATTACHAAGILDFVAKLPQGLHTMIPDGGAGLSSGQKQRLALARIFYHDPHVVILDEATSCLDDETEQSIMRHLAEWSKSRTVVMITHRPSVLRWANRVLTMEGGRLVEARVMEEPAT